MSLQIAAQNLAAKGRHGDTMLVHMSPEEVGGLQALAMAKGGSLTTNPDTGLPEAFKLRDILPIVAGFALGPAGFGLMSAGMAGLTVGGVEALRTGDLGKGLMAGLGAYGGAGLGQALMGAGASAAAPATGAFDAAQGLNAMSGGAGTVATPSAIEGVKALGTEAGRTGFMQGLGGAFPTTTSKIAAAAGAMPLMPQPEMPALPTQEASKYEGPYVPTERSVAFKRPDDTSTSEFSYFSPSNPVPGFRPMSLYAAEGGPIYSPDPNMNYDEGFAVGGLTALAGGRYLQGPGDGTSDSIPATIGNKQPARLADGEFVIDARTVSEIGNGSSNAGAKKLYAMMDRVHKARKKAGRGQDSKAAKYLPA